MYLPATPKTSKSLEKSLFRSFRGNCLTRYPFTDQSGQNSSSVIQSSTLFIVLIPYEIEFSHNTRRIMIKLSKITHRVKKKKKELIAKRRTKSSNYSLFYSKKYQGLALKRRVQTIKEDRIQSLPSFLIIGLRP